MCHTFLFSLIGSSLEQEPIIAPQFAQITLKRLLSETRLGTATFTTLLCTNQPTFTNTPPTNYQHHGIQEHAIHCNPDHLLDHRICQGCNSKIDEPVINYKELFPSSNVTGLSSSDTVDLLGQTVLASEKYHYFWLLSHFPLLSVATLKGVADHKDRPQH